VLKTLYGKLVAVLIVLFLLIGSVFVFVTRFSTELYQQEAAQKLNSALAKNIADNKQPIIEGHVDPDALKDIFHMLMVINPNIELYFLDTSGKILAYSAPPGHVKNQFVNLQPINTFLRGDAEYPLLGDDPRGDQRQKIFSVTPLKENGKLEGYLYIILGGELYDDVAQMLRGSHTLRVSLAVITTSLLLALLAGLLLFSWLTRRLRRLSTAMEHFEKSDFSDQATLLDAGGKKHGDEIHRLSASFNTMAERIIQQMQALKQTDATRREMVANVSHDLRTPLASLQGYLETILMKGESISREEQTQYIEIAAKHSRHLGKLIEELFELAKLDALNILVHCERVSMTELAQDVVQKFSLAADKKDITLQAHFERNVPYVSADIGLIVRALENLVENALRHTPHGGAITLTLIPGTDNITIRVSDTGCGIPETELPKIFDRFYRLEKSRQTDHGGAGLGLAITRRIVELHGSTINAVSKVNVGTTFSFQLPVVAM